MGVCRIRPLLSSLEGDRNKACIQVYWTAAPGAQKYIAEGDVGEWCQDPQDIVAIRANQEHTIQISTKTQARLGGIYHPEGGGHEHGARSRDAARQHPEHRCSRPHPCGKRGGERKRRAHMTHYAGPIEFEDSRRRVLRGSASVVVVIDAKHASRRTSNVGPTPSGIMFTCANVPMRRLASITSYHFD